MIIGIDTDSHGFHWCSDVPVPDPQTGVMSTQGHAVSSYGRAEDRYSLVFYSALEFFMGLRVPPIHVFCEEPLSLKNGRTNRILALSAGMVLGGFLGSATTYEQHAPLFWHWVDNMTWKRHVLKKGNIKKTLIPDIVRAHPAWTEEQREEAVFLDDPNLWDAWCILKYGEWFVERIQ